MDKDIIQVIELFGVENRYYWIMAIQRIYGLSDSIAGYLYLQGKED